MNPTSSSVSKADHPVYRSLGLKELCQRLEGSTGCSILDLGPARGANLAFWSRFSPSIHVADLYTSMPLPPKPEDDTQGLPWNWVDILGVSPGAQFDVVLTWDLFNYIHADTLPHLTRHLRTLCRPAGLVFSLLFDMHEMKAAPTVYRIVDDEHLAYEFRTQEQKPCPRHQPRDVTRIMQGFRTANSFLLRHGVLEYLFLSDAQM